MKTFIFDFDGTIADTFNTLVEINNKFYKKLGTDPIDAQEALELKQLPMRDWLRVFEVPFLKIPFFVKTIISELDKRSKDIKPFTGIVGVLTHLNNSGI